MSRGLCVDLPLKTALSPLRDVHLPGTWVQHVMTSSYFEWLLFHVADYCFLVFPVGFFQ